MYICSAPPPPPRPPQRATRPFWSSSIGDLIVEADRTSPTWSLIQAGWTWGQDKDIYVTNRPKPGRILFQERFQWGTFAYILNRRGMEAILDAHFTDRSPTGLIRLSDNEEVAETCFEVLETGIFVALPSLFVIQGGESAIAGRNDDRLNGHLHSNNIHTQKTMEVMLESLRN